jgi:hypothetical protein
MNRRHFLKASSVAAITPVLFPMEGLTQASAPALPPPGVDGWVSLLNGRDLTGWYTMLQNSGKGAAESRKMVVMEEEMLHIMGNDESGPPAEPGYLATNQEFENVHIRLEYKWGMKRFAPRTYSKRDNGLLYGLVGADKVWPTCVECQIEEGDVGDYFMVGTRSVQDEHFAGLFGEKMTPHGWTTPVPKRQTPEDAQQETGKFDPSTFRKIKDGNFEILDGWNTVEVIWQGDRSAHLVNGRCVNAASKLQQPDPANPGKFIPLTRGKIAIEIEFAEIWIRRIEVKALA